MDDMCVCACVGWRENLGGRMLLREREGEGVHEGVHEGVGDEEEEVYLRAGVWLKRRGCCCCCCCCCC